LSLQEKDTSLVVAAWLHSRELADSGRVVVKLESEVEMAQSAGRIQRQRVSVCE
jgi:hypothetical protein